MNDLKKALRSMASSITESVQNRYYHETYGDIFGVHLSDDAGWIACDSSGDYVELEADWVRKNCPKEFSDYAPVRAG